MWMWEGEAFEFQDMRQGDTNYIKRPPVFLKAEEGRFDLMARDFKLFFPLNMPAKYKF